MEANVPEKIYIDANEDWHRTFTAFTEKAKGDDIEYIRKDAFIEKACKFLSNEANIPLWEGYNDTFGCDTSKLVDNFRKYMEE